MLFVRVVMAVTPRGVVYTWLPSNATHEQSTSKPVRISLIDR